MQPAPTLKASAKTSLFVSLTGVLAYLNSLNGTFVFDDSEAIVNNADVRPETPVSALFSNDFWGHRLTSNISHKSYRPLTVLTFRWNYWFAGGLHPYSFHLVNVLLHAVVCYLVHLVNLHLFTCSPRRDGHVWALLASLLFAAHPIHTEVVSGLVGRADLLCSFFVLVCVLTYLRWLSKPDSACVVEPVVVFVTSGIAMLCKEYGIMALPLCFSYDVALLLGRSPSHLHAKNGHISKMAAPKRVWTWSFPARAAWLAVSAVGLVYLRWCIMGSTPPKFHAEDNPAAFADSFQTRTLTRNYLYALNGWLLVLPTWLCFDWSMGCVPLIESPHDPRVLGVFFFWCILLGLLGRAVSSFFSSDEVKFDARNLLLAMSWFVIPFLPAANVFFTVGFVIAERLLYLPSVGFCMVVAMGLQRLYYSCCDEKRQKSQGKKKAFHAAAALLVILFTFRAIQRNRDWLEERPLFNSGLAVCPNNAKVHYNIAKHAADTGDEDTAIYRYQMALRLNPVYDQAMNNLANLLKSRGHLQTAMELLQNATAIRPDFAAAWMNLGIVYAELKRHEDAERSYKNALNIRPRYPDCYYNLGNLYVDWYKKDEALHSWTKAIELKPTHSLAWINVIILLDTGGDLESAKNAAYNALVHLPDDPGVHFNLANTLGKMGELAESEKHFLKAVELRPGMASYHSNLGVLYHRWKKYGRARRCYENALKLEPGLKSARDNLALLRDKTNVQASNRSTKKHSAEH